MRADLFDREVEGERTPVQPEEREPERPATRGPGGHLLVEAARLRRGTDRGPALSLPAARLDPEALVEQGGEIIAPVVHVARHVTALVQTALQALEVRPPLGGKPPLVLLPGSLERHEGRALECVDARSAAGHCVPARLEPLRSDFDEAEREPGPGPRDHLPGDASQGVGILGQRSPDRRVPVGRRPQHAPLAFERRDGNETSMTPRGNHLEPAGTESPAPRGEPARTEEGRSVQPVGKLVPFAGQGVELMVDLEAQWSCHKRSGGTAGSSGAAAAVRTRPGNAVAQR